MSAHRTLLVLLAVAAAAPLPAQTLADRINSASQPRVQFTYAARPEVCGNGRTFIHVAGGMWVGNWNDDTRREPCEPGPVRVLLDRAGRDVVSIQTFAGPVAETPDGVADLGLVAARDAAAWLLSLAERSQGRVSRDAIMPAVIADSVDVIPRLVGIARNKAAPRETRSSAISWLARPLDARERQTSVITTAVLAVARDEDDSRTVRQTALRALARLEHGAGTTALLELAGGDGQQWLSRAALEALRSSGDPRARQHLRNVVRQSVLPDQSVAAAVRGLGDDFATADDVGLLRESFDKLPGTRSREAAMAAITSFGGTDNVTWLLGVARNADQPVQVRRRAIHHAYRAGASVDEIAAIYDGTTDGQLKDAVISTLIESGESKANDKLMQIARTDTSPQMRRKAVAALARSSDERVKKFLLELAGR